MKLVMTTTAFCTIALSASLAQAQFTFDPADSYLVGSQPSDTAIGDFNGDQLADIATTVDNPDRIELLINNGDGTFSAGGSVILPNSSSPGDIVAGDLDNDQDIDLAVALKDNSSVIVVLNQGGGTFVTGGQFATGIEPRGMSIGDHNNDNLPDIAVGNRDSNTATVLTNTGGGTFASAQLAAGAEPRGAAFGDIDGDNDLDLAVSCHDDRTVRIYTNNGGVFTMTATLSTGGQQRPEEVVMADLNGDQLDDVAVASEGNGFNAASVYLATGGGSFGGVVHYATNGTDSSDIVAADFNCDQVIDLATSNATSNNISVLPNLGAGTFGAATILAAGTEPENFEAGDLDNDQVADLALANKQSNNVTVHTNQTCDGPGGCNLALSVTNLVGGQTAQFEVTGADNGETVAVVYGTRLGTTVVSGAFNFCATFDIRGVSQKSLIGIGQITGGSFVATQRVPGSAAGLTVHFQAAQQGTCPDECVSNLVSQVVQ